MRALLPLVVLLLAAGCSAPDAPRDGATTTTPATTTPPVTTTLPSDYESPCAELAMEATGGEDVTVNVTLRNCGDLPLPLVVEHACAALHLGIRVVDDRGAWAIQGSARPPTGCADDFQPSPRIEPGQSVTVRRSWNGTFAWRACGLDGEVIERAPPGAYAFRATYGEAGAEANATLARAPEDLPPVATLSVGNHSQRDAMERLITDEASWAAWCREKSGLPVPRVDFARHRVFVAGLGDRVDECVRLVAERVDVEGAEATVRLATPVDASCASGHRSPYHVLLLPASVSSVRVVDA